MPLPGGPADKFGNRYELWWTVYQFVRMLQGEAESIRIETPGVKKAEFVLTSGGVRELHQAKRSHQQGKWSLALLAYEKLLQAMYDALSGNGSRFLFVSSSDAPELRELSERAKQAESVQEFESYFLDATVQNTNFKELRRIWNSPDVPAAFDVLRRIEVRTMDETAIDESVQWGLQSLFLSSRADVCAELRRIAEDSVHLTLTREMLIELLAARGYKLRQLTRPDAAGLLVSDTTKKFVAGARKKLIRQSLIPRAAAQALLDRLTTESQGSDSVLIGKAGAGKTGCIVEVIENLRMRGTPVLAFRLDRLGPVSNTAELGRQLHLEESPTIVLEAAANGGEAVLIVDQLDAVSTTSGRSGDYFDTVDGLIEEARGLRSRLRLHVVLVCRAFDWENDHRLRRLLSRQHADITVAGFTPEEVERVLKEEGFRTDLFQPKQLELLRLPQNLSLFLEGSSTRPFVPDFTTAKDLYDRYWDAKRRAVAERTAPQADQWMEVIDSLCEAMTFTQCLSVPREKLDRIGLDYLEQMTSEGVLIFDEQRYGFGHESFFDYCFARAFVAKKHPLVAFLTASEQHLFRRAQVRQVLAYLRDADRDRYCTELRELLSDAQVRVHLKDLATALIANVSDPGDDEWGVFKPWINSELAAIAKEKRNSDKFATLAWQHFFASESWFHFMYRHGFIVEWLASADIGIINMAVNYVRLHQRHSGDRVAELLEPYIGREGDWVLRLRHIAVWAELGNSRRFFDLFLRLLDDGTLDDAQGPIATNSTFWSMFYGLAKACPEWIPEVISHWLARRLALVQQRKDENGNISWHDMFNYDRFSSESIHNAVEKAPVSFVRYVLPAVLEISDAALYDQAPELPRRNAVWHTLRRSEHEFIGQACLNSLAIAMERLAKEQPVSLGDAISELKRRNTYIANYLLLNVYAAGALHFADEAAVILSTETWRLLCGYVDSQYWIAMQVIGAIVPVCSETSRVKLEIAILGYSPADEYTTRGYKWSGYAQYNLLSAIPFEYRSKNAQARFLELERKFLSPDAAPRENRAYWIGSPIEKQATDKMTDEQWLKAIAKYNSEERPSRWEYPGKGGAWELAVMLREHVRSEPERFARLSLRFPAGTHSAYLERTLDGLKEATALTELKLAVCRKAYVESREHFGKAIADVLGSIEEPLPDEAVEMVAWLATEHPDPDSLQPGRQATSGHSELDNDIVTRGINTTRGRAAEAIRDLVNSSAEYISRFRTTIERLINDRDISVRSCAASVLLAIARYDMALALRYFPVLADTDACLLGTYDAERLIYYGLRDHFALLRPYVQIMLRSSNANLSKAGARLSGLAALYHDDASDLAEEAMVGTAAQRHGIAEVAAGNLAVGECRRWCEAQLLRLFDDDIVEVRREAASCFRQLEKEPLEVYQGLITAFCDSAAYQEDSFSILHALEESLSRLPGITSIVCEKFLERFSDEAKDIRTHRVGDMRTVAKLIFRVYQQHQRDEWAPRCLDLIDRMCLEGIQDVRSELDQFER